MNTVCITLGDSPFPDIFEYKLNFCSTSTGNNLVNEGDILSLRKYQGELFFCLQRIHSTVPIFFRNSGTYGKKTNQWQSDRSE